MQNIAKYIAIIIASMAIGSAGAGLSFYLGQKQGVESTKNQMGQLNEVKTFDPILVLSMSGRVASIENNILSLDATGSLADVKKDIRKVVINDKTIFSRVRLGPPPVSTSFNTTEKPVRPKIEQLKLADLKVGDNVMVAAAEDIKTKQEFIATRVGLMQIPQD